MTPRERGLLNCLTTPIRNSGALAPRPSDLPSRVRFKSEPTLSEVSNKLEEQALRLRFSTESATRLEIARVLVHLAGHTYRLAGVPLVEPPYNLTMPAIELAGEWPGEGGREGGRSSKYR
jgi:hypothetical protein